VFGRTNWQGPMVSTSTNTTPLFISWAPEHSGAGIDDGGPQGINPKRSLAGHKGSPGSQQNKDEASARTNNLTAQIHRNPPIPGPCHTQLYDVKFKKNGLILHEWPAAAARRISDGSGQTDGRRAQHGPKHHTPKQRTGGTLPKPSQYIRRTRKTYP